MRDVVRSNVPPRIRESLDACWKEGVAAQVVVGIFDHYLIPYGLFLGAGPAQVGFLVASPSLLAALAQLLAVRAVHAAGTRHRLLVAIGENGTFELEGRRSQVEGNPFPVPRSPFPGRDA